MKNEQFGFNKKNYKLLFIGLFVNVFGFLLMIGGGAEQLSEFNGDELFSFSFYGMPVADAVIYSRIAIGHSAYIDRDRHTHSHAC